MKCSKCGFENPESFKFCCKCGAKKHIYKCPNCDTTLPYDGIFCPECGIRVRVEPIGAGNVSGIDACPTDLEFVVGLCRFQMFKVEGGTFIMGATEEQGDDVDDDERPAHKVTLTDYYIGQSEVTQALWKAVMEDYNPSKFKGDNLPVTNVCWYDCQAFIDKLNSLLSNELGGNHFALPTEAQWEFAARGGNKSQGYKYAGSNNIDDVAWFEDNSVEQTHPVAQKQPNELGLYDMSGNVLEWCQDRCGRYSSDAQTNPQGPADGKERVSRGGHWHSNAEKCRVSKRFDCSPGLCLDFLGLRLCLIP